MSITIHTSMLPQTDPDAALAFYTEVLGFELRLDVGYEGMRWLTLGSPDQPDTAVVLYPPEATPNLTDTERTVIEEMMAKGTYASLNLASTELDAFFDRIAAAGAEVVQEPVDQPYGVRDCAVRDPSGNLIRIQEAS